MRSILTLLTTSLSSLILAPTVFAARLLGMRHGEGSIYERCMVIWARSVLYVAGARIVEHGLEHRPRGRGAVYISNHVSWFDVFALAAAVPRCTFVAKRELRRLPLFGPGA